MERVQQIFLKILGSAVKGEEIRALPELTQQDADALFGLAKIHRVLPLVYHTVYAAPQLGDTAAIRSAVRRQESRSQFGLEPATRLHEVGVASNRGSALPR